MLPQMVLALLALAELSAVGEQQCLSGDRQPNVCFSTTPTLAATPLSTNASLADACCSACLQVPQCCCWTYDARNNDSHGPEAGDLCELKHLLVNGSTAPSCVSGTLPIAPPLVLPPPRGAPACSSSLSPPAVTTSITITDGTWESTWESTDGTWAVSYYLSACLCSDLRDALCPAAACHCLSDTDCMLTADR